MKLRYNYEYYNQLIRLLLTVMDGLAAIFPCIYQGPFYDPNFLTREMLK